jgi:hypothetical protein
MAYKFDEAICNKDADGLERLINEAITNINSFNVASQAQIFYCIGTVLGEIDKLRVVSYNEKSYEKQIYYYRKSVELINSNELDAEEYLPYIQGFKCVLHTNYANALNQVGRMVAAIEQYKIALIVNPSFGMANGSLGKAYKFYGHIITDGGHQHHLHHYAYNHLLAAVNSNDPDIYEAAKKAFKSHLDEYSSEYKEKFLSKPLNIKTYSYEDADEHEYRKWVLDNALFLNPLNDLPSAEFVYAHDPLQLPPITTSIDVKKPIYHEMFNQLKQEYIFARFQLYFGLQEFDEPHFADKDTHITNVLDYQQYSIRIEQIKSSFKTLYSLFDKSAFFINEYFELGIKHNDVSFSSIWYKEKQGKVAYKYKNTLDPDNNYAVKALYWIRKDFFRKFHESPYPYAKRVREMRNALEHRYTKVLWDYAIIHDESMNNELALPVSESELKSETLRLLKLVREVIIYLTLAVGISENVKNQGKDEKLIISMPLYNYDDDWKR